MVPSEDIKKFIRSFEKYSAVPYKNFPSEKYFTWGYGHYNKDVPDVKSGKTISRENAEKLFEKDLEIKAKELNTVLEQYGIDYLNQNQYDALLSMAYNMGTKRLTQKMVWHNIVAKDFDKAAKIIPATAITAGTVKPVKGLVRRREKEAEIFSKGYENA